MAQVKTNEREGTRAVLRYSRTAAFKVRPVLDLIRGQDVERAKEILRYSDRDAARLVDKLLTSAVANAENNDSLDPEELYVSACYADEATTMRRWRPRARGRATRIRKRSCHVTVIVSRMPEDRLARMRARRAQAAGSRSRRVAAGRQGRRLRRRQEAAEQPLVAQPAAAPEAEERPPEGQVETSEGGEPTPSAGGGSGVS
jgi:large subunit ribosomal protein L22